VLQCVLGGALKCTDTENVPESLLLFFSCPIELVLDCVYCTIPMCTNSQTSLTLLRKGRKSVPEDTATASKLVPGATDSASNGKESVVKKGTGGHPLPLRISNSAPAIAAPSPQRLKRTQVQLMAAAAAAASEKVMWPVDGGDVPFDPPAWDPATFSTLLCSQISVHNSYVSAMKTRKVAEAVAAVAEAIVVLSSNHKVWSEAVAVDVGGGFRAGVGADVGAADAGVDAEASIESDGNKVDICAKKRPRGDEHKEATAAAAASDTEDDIFVAPCQPAAKKNGVGRRHSGRHVAATKEDGGAVSEYTECGIGKPRIQSLRSYLNTKLHTLFLTPDCADSAFHSLNGRITFFESVVKRVGKVGHADVQTLLKELMVPEKSDGSKPSPKKLKLWLGKALNNVRNNLKKVTVRVWAEVTGYVGTKK